MKFPVLLGLDLSVADQKHSPSLETDKAQQYVNGKSFTRLHSRKKDVGDDLLDKDVVHTPSFDARDLASSRLSKTKRQLHEMEDSNHQGINGEDMEMLSERRRALFQPLSPNSVKALDSVLPPPDFDAASYPRGWVIGKKRKLVNVDVIEGMRRIAVQEMNRKDREINGLNDQLEEDARTMEHLQMELQQERKKRLQAEREKATLQTQADMLMTMLNELEDVEAEQVDDCQVISS